MAADGYLTPPPSARALLAPPRATLLLTRLIKSTLTPFPYAPQVAFLHLGASLTTLTAAHVFMHCRPRRAHHPCDVPKQTKAGNKKTIRCAKKLSKSGPWAVVLAIKRGGRVPRCFHSCRSGLSNSRPRVRLRVGGASGPRPRSLIRLDDCACPCRGAAELAWCAYECYRASPEVAALFVFGSVFLVLELSLFLSLSLSPWLYIFFISLFAVSSSAPFSAGAVRPYFAPVV